MRTQLLSTLSFGLALMACADQEDIAPTVDEADGIRAETRQGDGCGGDTCLVTSLTDSATNTPLATITWNADSGIGKLAEPHRTTQIETDGMQAMTAAEANAMSRHAWTSLTKDEIPLDANSACSQYDITSTTCACTVYTCIGCVPTSTGEYCEVKLARVCWAVTPMYVGRCG